jgi:hypothetical protein
MIGRKEESGRRWARQGEVGESEIQQIKPSRGARIADSVDHRVERIRMACGRARKWDQGGHEGRSDTPMPNRCETSRSTE